MNTFRLRTTGSFLLSVVLFFLGCETTRVSDSSGLKIGPDDTFVSELPTPPYLSQDQEEFSQALAHYVSGLIHRSKEEKTEALADFETVVALDPSREELREMIVRECFRNNDFKKAAQFLETALQKKPDSMENLTLLAIAYRSNKEWVKATEIAEKIIRLDPSQFTAYEVLFEVAIELNQPENAKKALDRAVSQKSEDFHFWLRLADLYLSLGEKQPQLGIEKGKIITLYEKAVALQPDDPAVLGRVADFYVLNQNMPKAIELYEQILEKQPSAENIRLKLALCYVSQEERKKAIQILEEIVQHEPFRFQVFTLIGEIHEELKDFEHALMSYRLSLDANPNQLAPHLKIILLELRNKHPDQALKQLDLASEKFSSAPQVPYFYALTHSELKNHKRAIEYFEESLKLAQISNPEILDAVFYFYYGAALERGGQYDKAADQFKKAIELNPDYAEAYNYLGFMYADKNEKLDEAQQLIEKALGYDPENGAFLDSLGWVYYRQGKLEKALNYLQRSIKVMGNDATIFDHIGDVCHQMGSQNEAIRNYQKSLELDPKNKDVLEKLRTIHPDQPTSTPAPKTPTEAAPSESQEAPAEVTPPEPAEKPSDTEP